MAHVPLPIKKESEKVAEIELQIREKFHSAMSVLVDPKRKVDDEEKRAFEEYSTQFTKIKKKYNVDSQIRLVEKNENIASTVAPIYQPKDFYEFPSAVSIQREILSDLAQFETYSKFNVDNLLANKVRENITQGFNKIA